MSKKEKKIKILKKKIKEMKSEIKKLKGVPDKKKSKKGKAKKKDAETPVVAMMPTPAAPASPVVRVVS
jgi:hypothetical protein